MVLSEVSLPIAKEFNLIFSIWNPKEGIIDTFLIDKIKDASVVKLKVFITIFCLIFSASIDGNCSRVILLYGETS